MKCYEVIRKVMKLVFLGREVGYLVLEEILVELILRSFNIGELYNVEYD